MGQKTERTAREACQDRSTAGAGGAIGPAQGQWMGEEQQSAQVLRPVEKEEQPGGQGRRPCDSKRRGMACGATVGCEPGASPTHQWRGPVQAECAASTLARAGRWTPPTVWFASFCSPHRCGGRRGCRVQPS